MAVWLKYERPFIFQCMQRLITAGLVLWMAGTVVVRQYGALAIALTSVQRIAVLIASAAAMAALFELLCRAWSVPAAGRPRAAIALAAPTLLFDPFTTTFFARFFPRLDGPTAAFVGGWLLACCAGALLVAFATSRTRSQ